MNVGTMPQNYTARNKMHPKKFAMYVACASIVMMFSAFTSAYIVRQAAGNWLEFNLPSIFFYNTLVLLGSSVALHGSFIAFKRNNASLYRILMIAAFILGTTFIALQYVGWQQMAEMGVTLTGNPSGAFVIVISGVHVAHLIGGLIALCVALLHAFVLKFNPTPARKLRFEITLIYWHFVDILWIYLLVFFVLQG